MRYVVKNSVKTKIVNISTKKATNCERPLVLLKADTFPRGFSFYVSLIYVSAMLLTSNNQTYKPKKNKCETMTVSLVVKRTNFPYYENLNYLRSAGTHHK